MRRYCLQTLGILLLLFAQAANGQTTIFDYGTTWKYLDNGTNQGTAWTGTGFNDATWASDTGFFGYGDPWITKCINSSCTPFSCTPTCGTKYITTYFRKVVNIPSIAIYDSIKMNIKRDDAVAVYVNGVEVWRDPNMPTGTLTYTSAALTALGGVDEYTPITKTIPISFFVAGNNTIAVELHQQSGTSSDLGFNMQMIGIPSLTLFDYGSAWKYLDNGTNQGTTWTGTGFSDATWASDTGFFGYGDPWITKCINSGCTPFSCTPTCGTKYITTYFRKVVNIANVAAYDSIRFNVKRDDGVAVYVNGVEVWRDPNLPGGTLTYTTAALTALGGVDEYTPITKAIPISFFVTGNNTIAVELHQQSGTSSDLGFNMQMVAVKHVAVTPVVLTQGPYLQKGSQTAVNVRWRTNIASKSRLLVGTTVGTYPLIVNDATLLTEHELRITGLNANTKYYYQFGTDTSVIQGDTSNFFVTAPADTSTREVTIAAFGDCGRNDNNYQANSLSAYQNYLAAHGMKAADLMLLVGDNAYDAGTDLEFSNNFFSRYSGNILKNHMLFPCPGNHDYANTAGRQVDHNVPYYSLFSLPSAGESGGVPSGTEAYYSYNWGNVHILSLDSYGDEDGGTTRLYDTLGAQVTWIKNDLAANNKKWVIAYWHHPPYTMGSHTSDGEAELVNIRQNFIRILERYGVDLIICGHSHDYERSYLMKGHYGSEASFNKAAHTADSSSAKYNGTTNSCPYTTPSGKVNHGTVYVVSGSSGASGGVQGGYPHNALPFAVNDGGMFFVDIKDNRLDAKFLRVDNTVYDQFTIMKDVKVRDTTNVFPGTTVNLSATWPGAYAWNTGAITRSISVVATADTTITVKDSLVHTCLTDQHYIHINCTTPVFTVCPANIHRSGCDAPFTYTVADTGTPNPVLTYTFSGATTGGGSGTGSGTTFNAGITNVTITATNACGSTNCNFTVTIDPLPNAVTVSGGGAVCNATTITAANGGDGTIYYQGTTAGGTSTAIPSVSQVTTTSGTYYFRAQSSAGCWGPEGSVTVTVNPLPTAVTASGAGTFCSSTTITAANGGSGTIYFQGTTSGGTSTATPATSRVVTTSGTYYFRAQSSAGCWGVQGSVTVTINPLPVVYNVTGGGSYCATGAGVDVALSGSETGVNYQLYNGLSMVGSPVSGTGGALDFGMQTSEGIYTVVARNATTLCSRNMSGADTVSIFPLPAVYTVTGGGNYCAGGTGVHVGLSSSATGISYQLYKGVLTIGSPVAGTGGALDFGLQTSIGSYTVVAENNITHCQNFMTGSASVSINALPAIYLVSGGGNYCAGGPGLPVMLNSSNTGINYQLYNGITPSGSPMAGGVGTPLDFGPQTAAGTYTVAATNATTGCSATMTGAATIAVDPLPAAYTVTGGGSYCSGGLGIAVGLSSSATGINYQLYRGGIVVGSTMPGTGASIDFGTQTVPGTYTVVASNATTGCTKNMMGSASVIVKALPVVYSVTGGGSYCAGGTGVHIGLSASQAGVRYYLYRGTILSGASMNGTGAPLDFGLRTSAGTYIVYAADTTTTCAQNMSGTAVVSITPLVFPSVAISSDKTNPVCAGETVTLTANPVNGGSAPAYQWVKNTVDMGVSGNTFHIIPANGDVIAVNMTSNATCASAGTPGSSMVMKVDTVITGSLSIVANPGTEITPGRQVTLRAIIGTIPAPTYEWTINGTAIAGATSVIYTSSDFSNGDSVSVRVFSGNSCGDEVFSASVKMHVGNVGIPTLASNGDIRIVPNPNKGEFTVQGAIVVNGGSDEEVQIEITNMLGQVIYKDKVVAQSGKMNEHIRLSDAVANGMYILNLRSGGESKVFHIVVGQ